MGLWYWLSGQTPKASKDAAPPGAEEVGEETPLPIEEQGAIGWEDNPYDTDYATAEGMIAGSEIETVLQRAARLGLQVNKVQSSNSNSPTSLTGASQVLLNDSVAAGFTSYIYEVRISADSNFDSTIPDFWRFRVAGTTYHLGVNGNEIITFKGGLKATTGQSIQILTNTGAAVNFGCSITRIEVANP